MKQNAAKLVIGVAAVLLAAGFAPANMYTYDASLGTLPSEQGWRYSSTAPGDYYWIDDSVSPSVLVQDLTLEDYQTKYVLDDPGQYWDFDVTGIDVQIDLAVLSSTYNPGNRRAGFKVSIHDHVSRQVALWFAEDRIALFSGGFFSEDYLFVPGFDVSDFHRYRILVDPAAGAKIFLDEVELPIALSPAEIIQSRWYQENFLAYGDGTSGGESSVRIRFVYADTDPLADAIPEPATMLAGLAGLAGIGRYMRRRT